MPDLAHLQSRRFTKDKYDPPTGIGRFSLVYEPRYTQQEGRVDVKVGVFYKFLKPSDTPTNESTPYLDWTQVEKDEFRRKAKQLIKDVWSNKYKFVCTDPAFGGLSASVNIEIKELGSPTGADYIISLRKTAQTHNRAWAGGCDHSSAQYEANFSNFGVEPRDQFGGQDIFRFKTQQLRNAVKDFQVALLPMDHKAATLQPADQKKVDDFIAAVKKVLGGTVTGINCHVVGLSTELMGSSRADERAQHFVNSVTAKCPNFFVVERSSAGRAKAKEALAAAGKSLGKYSGVALYIGIPPNSPQVVWTNYVVLTHEFGHMLGCPDEYTGIQCTGIKALMDLDSLTRTGIAEQSVAHAVAPAPGSKLWQDTSKQGTPDNVVRLQGQQQAFAKAISKAGVEAPVFAPQGFAVNAKEATASSAAYNAGLKAVQDKYGRGTPQSKKFSESFVKIEPIQGATDSIMFTGQRVMEAHYLPIWTCLGDLTKPYFSRSKWKIVPV